MAPTRRTLITQDDVQAVPRGGALIVPVGALITPLARQVASDRRVRLQERPAGEGVGNLTVALGSDHGGWEMKNDLSAYLRQLGYAVLEFGATSPEAVDYPDVAAAAARAVLSGRAAWAIVLDGAGIGSAMAANKLPGIRAAACHDVATARNSREHNHANVLTLGARMLDFEQARAIVRVWLETPWGGGRHAARVAKITALERR